MAEEIKEQVKQYESAAALTSFEEDKKAGAGEKLKAFVENKAGKIDRKKTLMVIAVSFAVVVMAGVIFSASGENKKKQDAESQARAAKGSRDFLRRERDAQEIVIDSETGEISYKPVEDDEPAALPEVKEVSYPARGGAQGDVIAPQTQGGARFQDDSGAASPRQDGGGWDGGGRAAPFTANRSSLVPVVIEGSLFSRGSGNAAGAGADAGTRGGAYAEQFPYSAQGGAPAAQNPYAAAPSYTALSDANGYEAQNNQGDKKSFYNSDAMRGGASGAQSGVYIGEDALWIGTVIPAVLETAVNTDLPGNIIARVTQNIYDSRSGRKLLVPQGTLLVAKYNSSVSYAQKRVQIVWDTLIRPDGYQVELEGMNAVDKKGMSGAEADYHENWFEYLKAAGIIAMFSVANSKMVEEAAKYGGDTMATGVMQGNAEFVQQMGGNIVSRAMNIQPTLTLDSGEIVNVMTNKNLFFPPVADNPVKKKYTLR